MATLKEIRHRIASVKKTRQITRAMKLVAAARLRRSQERIEAQRPYAYELRAMIAELASGTDREAHPLLARRPFKNVQILVLTSDRGLCGAFNANICRAAEAFVHEHAVADTQSALVLIGKKGREYFRRRKQYTVVAEYMDILADPIFDRVARVGEDAVAHYCTRGLDGLFLVYNEFKTAATQRVVVEQLLPILPEDEAETDATPTDSTDTSRTTPQTEFIYEPSRDEILERILPLHVKVQIWRAVLESVASEMGARMTAMDGATRNAEELIAKLTLQYNRARQEVITNELMEIVSGAGALER